MKEGILISKKILKEMSITTVTISANFEILKILFTFFELPFNLSMSGNYVPTLNLIFHHYIPKYIFVINFILFPK
jgi:hypothetical protein